jgi:hypothetical protein
VKEVAASLAQITLIIPVTPTVQIEDLKGLKTGLCERTTPTSWAKKIDGVKTGLLSRRSSNRAKNWIQIQILPHFE